MKKRGKEIFRGGGGEDCPFFSTTSAGMGKGQAGSTVGKIKNQEGRELRAK